MPARPALDPAWRRAGHATDVLTSRWLGLALVMALGLVLGTLTAATPALGLAAVVALAGALVLARVPDAPLFLFTLLLWSNAPVVAANYHDVPFFVAAAYPGLLLLPIGRAVLLERGPLLFPNALLLVYAYFLIALLGLVAAHRPADAIEELQTQFNEGVVIATLVVNAVRSVGALRAATWGLVVASLSLGGIPLLQQMTGAFDTDLGGFGQFHDIAFDTGVRTTSGAELKQFRLTGPIGETNRFAQILMTGFPLCWVLFRRDRRRAARFLAMACLLCCVAGFTLAFSRGAAVAAVLLGGVMVATRAVGRREVLLLVAGAAAVVLLSPGYRARLITIPKALTIFSTDVSEREADGAVAGRVTQMLGAARVYADNPVVGAGPGMFRHLAMEYGNDLGYRRLETERRAHSLYLEIAAEHGTLGLLVFGALMLVVLADLNRVRVRFEADHRELSDLALAYFLALSSYLASALFLHLSYVRYFWVVVGLAIAVGVVGRSTHPATLERSAPGPPG